MDETNLRALADKAYHKACLFMSSAATTGNTTLFNYMFHLVGSPRENVKPYEDALFSAADAGQIDMVEALLAISKDSGVKFDMTEAIAAAKRNTHDVILGLLESS